MVFILSIDIGIINLGYVFVEIKHNKIKVIECNRIDITNVKHNRVQFCKCKLFHGRNIPDYLDHFVQETDAFKKADIILIERQPPVGITNVQDLLFVKFRDRVILISPNSLHKHFGMDSDYTIRKTESEAIAKEYLENFNNFIVSERKHDISDAMLMIIYYFDKNIKHTMESLKQFTLLFEEFKFKI